METIFNPWKVAENLSSPQEVLRLKEEDPQRLLDALEVITKSEANHARRAVAAGASGIFLAIANAQAGILAPDDDVRVAVFEFRPLRACHSSLPNAAEEVQVHEHFGTCRRVFNASTGRADINLPVGVGSDLRDLASERVGPPRRARPAPNRAATDRAGAALHAGDSRTVAAVGSADCALSGLLVAQILAASTFPEQVVEADRWVQDHPDLKGDALGQAVDQQPWDPSVKALTAFPDVLGNMDKNLAWTSSLGDAYYNQQQDVMDAVQVMRQRAERAGNLRPRRSKL